MKKTTIRRTAIGLLLVIVLVLASTFIKVPFAALGPGPAFDTLGWTESRSQPGVTSEPDNGRVPVIQIFGMPADPTNGQLDMTTVNVLSGFNFFQMLGLMADPQWDVVPRAQLFPPGMSNEQVQQQQAAQMEQSENSAVIAAMNYLNMPVVTKVGDFVKNSPAAGRLQTGDQIVMVNGKPITIASDVHAALRGTKPGQHVMVSVLRDGQPVSVEIALMSGAPDVADRGLLGIGIYSEPEGPVSVKINLADVGGPSAGLIFALAIIDKLTPGSLTGGKKIAGTGTMDYDGTVGPIGGITHKLVGAERAGARYFLVPEQNCAEALTKVPKGMRLIKVSSLESALQALELLRAGKPTPSCRTAR